MPRDKIHKSKYTEAKKAKKMNSQTKKVRYLTGIVSCTSRPSQPLSITPRPQGWKSR